MSLPFQAEKTSAGCFFTENRIVRCCFNKRSIRLKRAVDSASTSGRFSPNERSIQPHRTVSSKRGSSLASFTFQFTKTFHLFRFQELINSAKMFFHTLVTELIYFRNQPVQEVTVV